MNLNKIQRLIHVLSSCADVVKVNLSGPTLLIKDHLTVVRDVTGKPENEVVCISWDDEEGQSFSVKFTEQGLSDAMRYKNCLTLEDHEGDEVDLYFFNLTPTNIVLSWE